MSKQNGTPRRAYGTGELFTRTDKQGRETWYGKWYADGVRVKRRIGPKRGAGWPDGLTQMQAEAELRRHMAAEVHVRPSTGQRLTLADAELRYRRHLQVKRRKRSTVMAVESAMRVWWVPLFGDRTLDDIRGEDIEDAVAMMEAGRRPGVEQIRSLSPKTIINYVGILGAVYHYAMHSRRRWASADPTDDVDLPELERNTDIRFLEPHECTAVEAAAEPGPYQEIDRALYVTAAQTGMRHGELRALRWRDVDWPAMRIRVRRNYVRGEFGTPKTLRSSRAIPMSVEVGGALERLYRQSSCQGDDELVFADPMQGGRPLSERANLRRFRKALSAAGLDTTHRIHDLHHTFGTRMAAVDTPVRTLQEWMGHRDIATTQRYADYAPGHQEAELVARAFGQGPIQGPNLSEAQLAS